MTEDFNSVVLRMYGAHRKAPLFWIEVICETCATVGAAGWTTAADASKTARNLKCEAVESLSWRIEKGMFFCSHECRNQALEEFQVE